MDEETANLLNFVDSDSGRSVVSYSRSKVSDCIQQLEYPWVNNTLSFVLIDSFNPGNPQETIAFKKLGALLLERKPKYFQ